MTQTPTQYGTIQPDPYQPPPPVSRTSGLAIASLILSLIFCCPGLGLIGVLLGLFALGATGRPGVSGRGLAIAGILIGLLVSGGQAAGGLAAYRFFKGAGTIIDEQMPAFAADFNEGNDRAIYDRCGQAMKDSTSFEDFQATMELARRKWGRMEMMGFWKMFTSGGVERHVDLTGGKQTVKFPANFSKAGTQQVQIVLLPERGQLKLVGIGFVGLTDDAGDGDGNNVEID